MSVCRTTVGTYHSSSLDLDRPFTFFFRINRPFTWSHSTFHSHGDVAPFVPWSPWSVYIRWVRLGAAPVDWVGGSVVGAMGARGRAVKRSGPRGEEEQNDWLSERGRLVPLIPLPPLSLCLSLSSHCSPSLSYARVTTSLHGRAAREQQRQHPPTDRRWGGAGAIWCRRGGDGSAVRRWGQRRGGGLLLGRRSRDDRGPRGGPRWATSPPTPPPPPRAHQVFALGEAFVLELGWPRSIGRAPWWPYLFGRVRGEPVFHASSGRESWIACARAGAQNRAMPRPPGCRSRVLRWRGSVNYYICVAVVL